MDKYAEFLRARYDALEKKAKAAATGPWHQDESQAIYSEGGAYVTSPWTNDETDADLEFIAANDPAYVLADIAAKRKILDELNLLRHHVTTDRYIEEHVENMHRLLCEPFASHPSYPGERQ